ncbi:MAG: polysaccharide/polyol phosphate ABC transporter ATP-binding protein, partial [Bacteroidia bacterium]|nr:polysaccharide/polyol phosphate ABC transporter ATP-binding protein [Bacteroidia bacterium]
ENERLEGEEKKIKKDVLYSSYSHQHHSYISRGFYAKQIKHWLKYFKLKQMLFLDSQLLFDDSQKAYDQVTKFLGIKKIKLIEKKAYNSGAEDDEAVDQIKELKPFFREANEELFELLGQKFNWK